MSVDNSNIIRYGANSAHYVILGDPVPWARPGTNFKNRSHYDTQKPQKYVIAAQLVDQHGDRPLFKGPLELIIYFYMRIPRASSGRRIPQPGEWHFKKPDNSNLLKFIEDIGNAVLYEDDCLFARTLVQKIYDDEPRLEFTISELR